MAIDEKRQFTRVSLVAEAKLGQGNRTWRGRVVDISFKGVLITSQTPFILDSNESIVADIFFENNTSIKIKVKEAHNNGLFYGFNFLEFNDDGMKHLRHIIMDNLVDDISIINPMGEQLIQN
ncbi:MAG: hypothetical protein ACI9D5_001559 [Candidatus Endobugula sp.]|jgi:c-di-GMP-binding flagellar brake protein YcgR